MPSCQESSPPLMHDSTQPYWGFIRPIQIVRNSLYIRLLPMPQLKNTLESAVLCMQLQQLC
jgi:hypothetical protein